VRPNRAADLLLVRPAWGCRACFARQPLFFVQVELVLVDEE
jgi:hypothetical protein